MRFFKQLRQGILLQLRTDDTVTSGIGRRPFPNFIFLRCHIKVIPGTFALHHALGTQDRSIVCFLRQTVYDLFQRCPRIDTHGLPAPAGKHFIRIVVMMVMVVVCMIMVMHMTADLTDRFLFHQLFA